MSTAGTERRELAARLRTLRELAGLSTTRLAAMLGWSQSKVSKIENGRTKPSVADVEAWPAAVDAPSEVRPTGTVRCGRYNPNPSKDVTR